MRSAVQIRPPRQVKKGLPLERKSLFLNGLAILYERLIIERMVPARDAYIDMDGVILIFLMLYGLK